MANKLLSIVVPAYNEPAYLAKALESVRAQSYRPIELIISDDNSPINLEEIVQKQIEKSNNDFEIKFFRQETNLGYYWNLRFVLGQAKGDYLVMLDHDDWFIDPNYFADAINMMEANDECNFCIANTALELSPYPWLNIAYSGWHYLDGRFFMEHFLFDRLHPVRTSTVVRFDRLRDLGYFNFFIDKVDADSMSIYPDEAFVSLALLCAYGKVAVSGRLVVVRGEPSGSLSKTRAWFFSAGNKMFVQYYLLYKYFINIGCNEGVNIMIKNLLIYHPVRNISFNIMKFLNYEKAAVVFILFGATIYRTRWLAMLPVRLVMKCKKLTLHFLNNVLYRLLGLQSIRWK